MITVAVECPLCGCVNFIKVPVEGYLEWQRGGFIQHALPELSAEEREMLISGICPDCWDNMFGEED